MRGIEVPERTEDFTADPVELFFDLAYVLAISQLVDHLIDDPTWPGVGQAVLVFFLLWLPWSQFTWSANAVSGNGRTVRVLFLVGTAISVPMAASVTTAFGVGGPVFAISLAVIYGLAALTMALGVDRDSPVRRSIARFGTTTGVGIAVLVAGSFLDGGARTAAWVASVAVVLVALAQAGGGTWILRTGHFAERHGLLIIIALGEVVVAVGAPVLSGLQAGEGVPGRTMAVLAACAVLAGEIWWSYFDRVGPALEHRGGQLDEAARGRYGRDVYTFGHFFVVGGVVAIAAALEVIALHPAEPVAAPFRALLAGGFAVAVAGVALGVWIAFRKVAWERLAVAAGVAALLAVGGGWSGLALLVAVDLLVAALLVAEQVRIER